MDPFEAFGVAWVAWFCAFWLTERVNWRDRNRLGLRFFAHAALAISAFIFISPTWGLIVGFGVGGMAYLDLKGRRAA